MITCAEILAYIPV